MTTPARTISLLDQIKAAQALYDRALAEYDSLSDAELDRVLGIASASTIARVFSIASASTIARLNLAVPIVENLDAQVLAAVLASGLRMGKWHCGTTHCRGGWAITKAGAAGAKLEEAFGPEVAARLIYEASTEPPPSRAVGRVAARAGVHRGCRRGLFRRAEPMNSTQDIRQSLTQPRPFRACCGRHRAYASPEEAAAYDEGHDDFPAGGPRNDGPYWDGFFDAEQEQQERADERWGAKP